MAASTNGRPPSDEAKRLLRRDYTDKVVSLGQQSFINRHLLEQSIGQFDPENIPLSRLFQMRRDPMIQMGLHYVKAPLISAEWHIDCEDPKIAKGIEEMLRVVYGPYMRVLLNALDFGYQAAIKRFRLGTLDAEYEDPDSGEVKPVWDSKNVQPVVPDVPLPIPPDYVSPRMKEGHFDGISTTIANSGGDDNRKVPTEFSVWVVNEFEGTFRNWYGFPRSGYAYRYWWSYWFRHHMWDRHFEMDADPALQVWYPPGTSRDEDGNDVSNRTVALQIGNDLRSGSTIAIPSDVHYDEQGKATTTPLWKAEFLTGGENLEAFRSSAGYLDVMKLRSILVPEQALVEGEGGTSSRNVAASYGEIFNESLEQLAKDVDTYFNNYVIPQLVEANWGPDAPAARKVTSGFVEEDMTLAQDLIKLAFQLDPNALPIKFEDLLKQVNMPVYSAAEQEERAQELEQMQQEQMQQRQEAMRAQQQAAQEQQGNAGGPPQQGAPPQQGQEQQTLSLHQHAEPVEAAPTVGARREFRRRNNNIAAVGTRLEAIVQDRYTEAFKAAADFFLEPEDGIQLGVKDVAKSLIDRIKGFVRSRTDHYDGLLMGELASLYHVSGAAELQRLGLDLSSWDVGRQEVQDWASQRAGELITTMDQTLVENELRPFLEMELDRNNLGEVGQDISPIDSLRLGEAISQKFQGYPRWMANRVARTEARMGYNNAALDIWEQVGVDTVQAYDGLGGLSGKTDLECMRRNGEVMTLAEARAADLEEHPNGTLGFVPVVEDLADLSNIEPGVLVASAVRSPSIYAVNAGSILTEQETGELLAGVG